MFRALISKFNSKAFLKRLLLGLVIFFILSIIITTPILVYAIGYQTKIYPGVKIGYLKASGLTLDEAREMINIKLIDLNESGIKFIYNGEQTVVSPTISSLGADNANQLIAFDPETSINKAFLIGREGNSWKKFSAIVKALFFKEKIDIKFELNKKDIQTIIYSGFADYHLPAENAQLVASSTNGQISFSITPDKNGKIIDFDEAYKKLNENLLSLDASDIYLSARLDYPKIKTAEVGNIIPEAEKALELSPLTLVIPVASSTEHITRYIPKNKRSWLIEKNTLAGWLGLEKNSEGQVVIGIKPETVAKYLEDPIASTTNVEPIDARFKFENERVVEFQANRDGFSLNAEKTIENIRKNIINHATGTIELAYEISASKIQTGDTNNLGIKEVVGTGHSNFAGSPNNRRVNIRVGANAMNGRIIAPDEEFSLVAALGEVSAKTGYLPELVIKQRETIPEYGGGLCQVATTLFRAAIHSGLPITARKPHAYRVVYYEPAGFDAAVYIPWPDVRFINDTGNNILIQTFIDGNDIYFDFWGTKDGRIVEATDPVIYNITSPGSTKMIETLELPVGEKKCTEKAHAGADAYFDYKVTYSNGEVKEERFSSHYVPWQAVCYVGVEKLSEDVAAEEAASASSESATGSSTENVVN